MARGVSLTDQEKEYINLHIADGPGRIAFELGRRYPHDNGGYRSLRTVQMYLYRNRLNRGAFRVSLRLPAWIAIAAKEQDITVEDMSEAAGDAIKGLVRQGQG